ncbi:peptidoglycan-binding domain-containing protein [Leptolyngbya ohadii]|uniref:peptidoglycan-binding domain-containing protein n=1 Tax=Leptolyngbya ohadii TaxID=1962290 RepID=UPI000B59C309|nr:peptidoglycan-binding protein [Leptolyngbya ohadii]
MSDPVLVRVLPHTTLRLVVALKRSASRPGKRSVIRFVFTLLALTIGWGSGTLVERSMAQSIPFEVAQAGSVLQLNDSGAAVTDLQQRLTQLGFFSEEVTGFFGTATQSAVREFQRSQGLTPDGIVGAATQAALGQGAIAGSANNAARDVLQLNDSGEQVAELQRRLAALGYYSGSASGTFDGATQFAVATFQQANGLTADGIVGPATTEALRRPEGQVVRGSAPAVVTPAPTTPTASAGNLLRRGSSGMAVSTLQTQLQSLGFYVGPITGVYDAPTESAVITFQQSKGLVADGIAGPQVNAALASATGSIPGNATAIPGTGTPGIVPGAAGTQAYSPAQMQYIQQMQQAQIAAEQARQEAEQARLEAEKARLVYQQNLQEGRYSTVELQRQLQENGFNPGEINGIMNSTTESAISEAQRKYGLSEGDFLGTSTTPIF